MADARQESVSRGGSFYQNYFQFVIILLIVAIFLILAMVTVVLYQLSHRPLPQFKAMSNGKIMKLTSFDEPNYLPSTLLTWASKASVAAYTFDFVNYNKQIAEARQYFTTAGWTDYQGSVSRLVRDIAQKQLFINGVVSGPPVISSQGNLLGRGYVWRMQLPFLVTYQTSEAATRQNFLVMMTVVKVPTYIDPRGIGIDTFVMR